MPTNAIMERFANSLITTRNALFEGTKDFRPILTLGKVNAKGTKWEVRDNRWKEKDVKSATVAEVTTDLVRQQGKDEGGSG